MTEKKNPWCYLESTGHASAGLKSPWAPWLTSIRGVCDPADERSSEILWKDLIDGTLGRIC